MEAPARHTVRFGTFEVDRATGELRKGGRRISLQEQPFRLLILLLEHPGEVVARTEIREKIWGETYVDFEEGINTAVRKLRDALGDSAANPRFVETLPRRGYRFIAPVELTGAAQLAPPPQPARSRKKFLWLGVGGLTAVALVGGLFVYSRSLRETTWAVSPPVQLTRDSGLTSEPAISRDGKLLAYASDRAGDGNLDIWIQHTSGGEPRRLTNHPADDRQPEISPDGSVVLFRSERDPRGIYSIPTLGGGEPRLIVKDGYVPRFSPDGSRIAYALGQSGSGGFTGKLNVYTLATESTHGVATDQTTFGAPAWSPDGGFLVFIGANTWAEPPLHLWSCSSKGGPATQMSDSPVVEDRTLVGQVSMFSVSWFGNQIILSLKQGDSLNLWAGTIASDARQVIGQLRRLTLGSGNEALPSVSVDGKLVFASHNYASGIWETTPAKDASTAPLRPITLDRARNYRPSISADGAQMAYVSDRSGNTEIWIKNLATGSESAVTRSAKAEVFVSISRDGSQIAFWDGAGIYVASATGGTPRLLCEKCGRPDDWSPDGKLIMGPGLELRGIGMRDPATSTYVPIAVHQTHYTTGPDLSFDGKWLAFHTAENITSPERRIQGRRQLFVVPYTGGWIPPENWIAITDGTALDREAKWSPDGGHVYFLSDRDGFRCIWTRNLDPITKRPLGSIYPVVHLHDARLSLMHIPNTGNVSICPVRDKLIFAIGELTGNIWMTDLRQK